MVTRREKISQKYGKPLDGWRSKTYTLIFEADTQAGKWFDRLLIASIIISIVIVIADSVQHLNQRYSDIFNSLEWFFTISFTIEYIVRLLCVRKPIRYAFSFFGVVDFMAIFPSYLAFFFPEAQVLIDVRALRLLRVFRIFRLHNFVQEYQALGQALVASSKKIFIFLSVVVLTVLILGTLMYVVEGPSNGFTSIPMAIYWAITTVTTVGFGDLTPQTDLGRFIASLVMLLGWGTLAVPTGIVTKEIAFGKGSYPVTTRTCHECLREGHLPGAHYCWHCGVMLPQYQTDKIQS
jgi:voltage-gated potassium channel